MTITAQTARLTLRHLVADDADALVHVFCDTEVMRFSDGIKTPGWVRAWCAGAATQFYAPWGFGPYAVVTRDDGQCIGYCGLFRFDDIAGHPEIEIGYRLARAAWGRGYATEAAITVRDLALDARGISRLVALIDPDNAASLHVARKIGMRYEQPVMLPGYTHPDHLFTINAASPREDARADSLR
jgi:[ribosomal protein S5]-alanine N-acetyltransferase